MFKKIFLASSFAFFSLNAISNPLPPLETVSFVDVNQYLGRWYQIARNELPFEKGCVCSQQTLSVRPNDNLVGVYNSCNLETPQGQLIEISGTAKNDDPLSNSKFTVDFGLPQTGQYWIIGLDKQYRYAIVSDPTRYSLYILSKTPKLDDALYSEALATAAKQVDTSKLVRTLQKDCRYP